MTASSLGIVWYSFMGLPAQVSHNTLARTYPLSSGIQCHAMTHGALLKAGKTSLCKGLAQKLAIRLSHTYAQGHLVEVNAHSLFSKWFSESGKMVMAMFSRVREILEDGDAFVCVLIDEVESLSAARQVCQPPTHLLALPFSA